MTGYSMTVPVYLSRFTSRFTNDWINTLDGELEVLKTIR
jgi:hypothetical protein